MKRYLPILTNGISLVALSGVILLAAHLRLSNVTNNPGWFADEGSNLDVAYHLRQGQLQYMALGQSTLMVSRLVLFEGLLATLLTCFGGGITTLRILSGVLGIGSVLMLYLCAQRLTRKTWLALLSALLLAIYPQAILYSRFGFSYNLLPLLVLPAYIGLWEYMQRNQRGWLMLAAVLIGLGTISDIWMLALIAPFGLIVLLQRWRDLLWSVPLVLLPFCLYIAFLWSQAPQAMMTDLRFVLFRVSNVTLLGQLQNVAMNYTVLLSQDFWMPCAIIGFLLLRPIPLRQLTLVVFFLTLVVLGRTIALYSLRARKSIISPAKFELSMGASNSGFR